MIINRSGETSLHQLLLELKQIPPPFALLHVRSEQQFGIDPQNHVPARDKMESAGKCLSVHTSSWRLSSLSHAGDKDARQRCARTRLLALRSRPAFLSHGVSPRQ